MQKDFDDWNEIKKITDETDSLVQIKTGEIRWCRFGLNIGDEIIGKGDTFHRPVLVMKKFTGNVFLGLPITSKAHEGDWYCQTIHDGITQTIILNQARILDRKRLEEKMYEISEAELEDIKRLYCELIMKP
jgi:mRNA interferase MazF